MKLVNIQANNNIEVGDLVSYNNGICLVIHDTFNPKFYYRVVKLTTGEVINGFSSLESLSEDCILIAKSKSLELKVRNE